MHIAAQTLQQTLVLSKRLVGASVDPPDAVTRKTPTQLGAGGAGGARSTYSQGLEHSSWGRRVGREAGPSPPASRDERPILAVKAALVTQGTSCLGTRSSGNTGVHLTEGGRVLAAQRPESRSPQSILCSRTPGSWPVG